MSIATLCYIIGGVVALAVAGVLFVVWRDKNELRYPLIALASALLILGVACFIAEKADPVLNGEYAKQFERTCADCGNEDIAHNDIFCRECGVKLKDKKRCSECNYVLAEADKFCADCGTAVEVEEQ